MRVVTIAYGQWISTDEGPQEACLDDERARIVAGFCWRYHDDDDYWRGYYATPESAWRAAVLDRLTLQKEDIEE